MSKYQEVNPWRKRRRRFLGVATTEKCSYAYARMYTTTITTTIATTAIERRTSTAYEYTYQTAGGGDKHVSPHEELNEHEHRSGGVEPRRNHFLAHFKGRHGPVTVFVAKSLM
jgi:hypothetical protein